MLPAHLLTAVCLSFAAIWAVLSSSVLVSRVLFERRTRLNQVDAARLMEGPRVTYLSVRRLRRLAAGDRGAVATAAARAVMRPHGGRLVRTAARRGAGIRRFRALRILARGGSTDAVALLRAAIDERNPITTAAAIGIVAELDSPAADALLLDLLVAGDHPRSRTATELEPRAVRIRTELVALGDSDEPSVRYWVLTLLRRAPVDEAIESTAVRGARDVDPRVRAAAARLLACSTGEPALESLQRLLRDDVFFVRAHAARGVGALGATALAGELSELLADSNWWVRVAARESLLALGPPGVAAAVEALDHSDRFAREGARDVVAAWRRLHERTPDAGIAGPHELDLLGEIRSRAGDRAGTRPSRPVEHLEPRRARG